MVLFVQTSWQEQERILRAECQLLEARNVELEQQNRTLHAQMETVSFAREFPCEQSDKDWET